MKFLDDSDIHIYSTGNKVYIERNGLLIARIQKNSCELSSYEDNKHVSSCIVSDTDYHSMLDQLSAFVGSPVPEDNIPRDWFA